MKWTCSLTPTTSNALSSLIIKNRPITLSRDWKTKYNRQSNLIKLQWTWWRDKFNTGIVRSAIWKKIPFKWLLKQILLNLLKVDNSNRSSRIKWKKIRRCVKKALKKWKKTSGSETAIWLFALKTTAWSQKCRSSSSEHFPKRKMLKLPSKSRFRISKTPLTVEIRR